MSNMSNDPAGACGSRWVQQAMMCPVCGAPYEAWGIEQLGAFYVCDYDATCGNCADDRHGREQNDYRADK